MNELERQILKRMDMAPVDSPWCAALFDMWSAVKNARIAAESGHNQSSEPQS